MEVNPVPIEEASNSRAATVATLADVAARAGVSISTAGRVLRQSTLPVAANVAERVRKAAAELRYVPNVAARSLRGAQPRMIGLVVGDMLDPYYGEIAEVVTQTAESSHGMLAIVCNMQRDPLLELKYCRQLWEHRVAGLILTGGGFDQHVCAEDLAALIRSMKDSGVAVTTLGPRFMNIPIFSADNEAVGRVAAEHLLAAGHRNIGIVTGSTRSETARLRLEGSLVALREQGASTAVQHADFARESVIVAIASLMQANPGLTGILAGSDFMARVAMEWLEANGFAVPQDVSVVGIGNTALAELSPHLTTVELHLAACSRAALDHIAARSAGTRPADFIPPQVSIVLGVTVARLG
jgi:LacI family transcriptional regulator